MTDDYSEQVRKAIRVNGVDPDHVTGPEMAVLTEVLQHSRGIDPKRYAREGAERDAYYAWIDCLDVVLWRLGTRPMSGRGKTLTQELAARGGDFRAFLRARSPDRGASHMKLRKDRAQD